MKRLALAALLLAGCSDPKPVAPDNRRDAIVAAERRAVNDTDAAMAEAKKAAAAAPEPSQATGTNEVDGQFPR